MNIREIRLRLGLSQSAFAKILGVTKAAVSHWETGLRKPNEKMLRLALEKTLEKIGKSI